LCGHELDLVAAVAPVAVVADHPVDDEAAAPINGRPDFHAPGWGVTLAKKHPPFVFGIRGVSCLVHEVLRVELHWWRVAGHHGEILVKLKRPVMIATTRCAQSFRLEPEISRTCQSPNPDALLCGRCQAKRATFPKRGPARDSGLTRQEAHVKLGCVVKGY
jgi:hypothetical protein